MGQFGRISRVAHLPSKKVFSGYIKQAMKLIPERPGRVNRSGLQGSTPERGMLPLLGAPVGGFWDGRRRRLQ